MNNLAAANAADALIQKIAGAIVNPIIIVMFAFALVGFLWGVRAYISSADDPEARAKGATHMLWGVIGMALMIMSFAIVKIVLNTFGLSEGAPEVNNVIGN